MGIIRKGNSNIKGDSKPSPKVIAPNKKFLQDNEIGFIIAKMRQATYQGSEFELFYKVIHVFTFVYRRKCSYFFKYEALWFMVLYVFHNMIYYFLDLVLTIKTLLFS